MKKKKYNRKPKKLTSDDLREKLKTKFFKNPSQTYNAKQIMHSESFSNNKDSVNHALNHLSNEGFLIELNENRFKFNKNSVKNSRIFEGKVDMTKHGSAYIISDGLESDVFVPRKRLKGALDNDRVEVMVLSKSQNKYTGEVIKIVQRNTTHFVGKYQSSKSFGFVLPLNNSIQFDIYVHDDDNHGAKNGDTVIVKVDKWPTSSRKSPIGHIERILSEDDMNEVRMQSILAEQGFSEIFPAEVEKEVAGMHFDLNKKERERRRDFRDVATVTIDPFDAKDFDDAISLKHLENGQIEIGVHIADVTHYVKPNTALDKEAYKRSTSVYLVDRTAPMLPEKLSNELCSLRPNEDSMTFSAAFVLDKDFGVIKSWFGKSIIHSDYRFSYEDAQDIINGDQTNEFQDELRLLNKVAKTLRERRMKKSSLEFETDEIKIILDEDKKPIDIKIKERLDTHLLVEEFMLLANKQVGTFMANRDKPNVPFIYRIHDLPDEDRMTDFALLLKEMGFQFYMDSPQAIKSSIKRLNEAAKADEALKMIQPMAIRMMSKAVYSTDNIGHFGLGFENYSHFTSPIRRYSDVLAHRILQQNLDKITRFNKQELEAQCVHISNQERKAMEAERDSIKYKKAEFMKRHIGEEYDGIVSGIIDRGVFVQITENHCEGMVPFDRFDENYDVAESRLEAVARESKDVLKVGDKLRVKIIDVDVSRAEVDMDLVF
ncbi:ribonuclease R [Membranicola marinus]|uniref:Ribonuclease R n=1 Tax=Membranihabitans marinus TaxID=1227546 RepID=A0A953HL69_9BACT|nr:ribonuclease R [Membranihabitans marinus]MBY5956528.1 ribonuclease R [Membranihabitans marinus]